MYTTKSNHQTKTKPGHTGATIKVIIINIGIILSDYVYGDKVVTYLMISLKRKMLYIYIYTTTKMVNNIQIHNIHQKLAVNKKTAATSQ